MIVRRFLYAILFLALVSFMYCWGCQTNFEQFGEFSIVYKKNGCKEITDGIGRKLFLVPYGYKGPARYNRVNMVRIPVRRVVVCSPYNAALIKAIGCVNSIVGIISKMMKQKDWHIVEIRNGLDRGKIAYIGQSTSVDYEKLRALKPDVVFVSDESIVPKLDELSIPSVVTTTKIAKDLKVHINFIRFISAFYNREQQAMAFAESQFRRIDRISEMLRHAKSSPSVIWGDIYARKVRVEPGNSWAGQMVVKAGGKYLFQDLEGASCMQVTIEKFFSRAKNVDIFITYRGPESGITSKERLRQSSRLLQTVDIRPMYSGKVYFTGWRLYQSADTAGMIAELAAIFHPELFPEKKKPQYFFELPERLSHPLSKDVLHKK